MSGRLPRRSPLRRALALLVTLGCWGALFTGVLSGLLSARGGAGLMFAGGWTLSLLPVHSARFRPRSGRRGALPTIVPLPSRTEAAVRAWWDGIRRLRRER